MAKATVATRTTIKRALAAHDDTRLIVGGKVVEEQPELLEDFTYTVRDPESYLVTVETEATSWSSKAKPYWRPSWSRFVKPSWLHEEEFELWTRVLSGRRASLSAREDYDSGRAIVEDLRGDLEGRFTALLDNLKIPVGSDVRIGWTVWHTLARRHQEQGEKLSTRWDGQASKLSSYIELAGRRLRYSLNDYRAHWNHEIDWLAAKVDGQWKGWNIPVGATLTAEELENYNAFRNDGTGTTLAVEMAQAV